MCVFLRGIRQHRESVLFSDITLATRIARIILPSGMASTSTQAMDIMGSKSELRARRRVWLPGFAYFAEESENLAIVSPPEGQEDDDVYRQAVRSLNATLRFCNQARHCGYGPRILNFP